MSPRNKILNEEIKDARREQILSNALKLFARRGLAATKITDISTASNISQGLLYHYYKSKEEIFVELLHDAYDKMIAAVLALERLPLSPLEKIRMAIEKLLQGFAENKETAYYYLLINQASIFEAIPDEAKEIVKSRSLLHEVITRIIIAGQKDGTFKKYDAQDMAVVFWASLNGLAIYNAVQGENFRAPDANILIGMFTEKSK
ncbi:tetr bacterial regulatory protein hth signature [Lucifera butyrica]|uniref:Tetr bacterial regulatory protein hth signature n=1 Tax=Lucifera butyrica TaxID=1351585 RepID=A0A498RC52_9FIRM|nr:TetR/AcrR family transcriptional regulator [Lucifera butyrica]VBB07703.1 tetr bacterial regulatory protein hth signature [Lucifera butyrica]